MGKEVGGGLFVMMDATRTVKYYHMRWTGIRTPALNIALLVMVLMGTWVIKAGKTHQPTHRTRVHA